MHKYKYLRVIISSNRSDKEEKNIDRNGKTTLNQLKTNPRRQKNLMAKM